MIHRRGKELDIVADYPDDPFVPWATMFKLDGPDNDTVACVACPAQFPLSDLLQGELEEDKCPECCNHAGEYWRLRTCRVVPTDLGGLRFED